MKKLFLAATISSFLVFGAAPIEAQPKTPQPEQSYICVIGGVPKPGIFYFPKGTKITFAKAFALAGVSPNNKDPEAKRLFIRLELDNTGIRYLLNDAEILQNKAPLQNGDIIYFPQPARPPFYSGEPRLKIKGLPYFQYPNSQY